MQSYPIKVKVITFNGIKYYKSRAYSEGGCTMIQRPDGQYTPQNNAEYIVGIKHAYPQREYTKVSPSASLDHALAQIG